MFAVAPASKVKGPVAFALVAIPMRELRFHVSKPQWSSMSAKNMRQARASRPEARTTNCWQPWSAARAPLSAHKVIEYADSLRF